MLKYGESVEEIMKESGLSREEIERIKWLKY
jgi:predicted transposase YdaD